MVFAFGHLVGAWLLGKVFEKFKRKLTRIEWALLLFGGILPDIDFLIEWTTNLYTHRLLTHSLTFALVTALTIFILAHLLKDRWKFFTPTSYSYAIFIGICIHLLLDMFYTAGIPLFWPYQVWVSYFGINYELLLPAQNFETYKMLFKGAVLDMAIGTLWLGWFTVKKKIEY